jgi:hypothetical protein
MGWRSGWKAITAAVFRRRSSLAGGYALGPNAMQAHTQEWQAEAAELYNMVPELRYGIYWIASSSSRAKLIVAKNPTGETTEPTPLDRSDPAWLPLLELAPTEPEQAMLLFRIVTLMKLLGRWRLVGFDTEAGNRQWLVASEYDYRESGDGIWVHDTTSGCNLELRKDQVWSIPMYMPHPVKSAEPDAPTRALIGTLHELLDLSGHVQTAAKSRLAGAGLLLVPNSLTTVTPGQSRGVNPPEGDPLMHGLMRTAQTAIRSPNDVSRHLPVMIRGNQEALQGVRHLSLSTPFDERVDELRTSAVRRIAIGLDLPAEVLTGMGDLNHWTAWAVEASGNRVNIEPTLSFVSRELTVKFLQPALAAMGIANPHEYMITFDDAAVQNESNKGDLALAAFELGIISADAARTALGYGVGDAPAQGQTPPGVAPVTRGQEAIASEVMPSGLTRLNDRLRDLTNRLGPASGRESQVQPGNLAADGWASCADLASRQALRRCGQRLIGSSRTLRGKYKDVPLEELHTCINASSEVTAAAMRGAFDELRAAAPHLVDPIAHYVRFRIETGTKHDKSEMCQYLMEEMQARG